VDLQIIVQSKDRLAFADPMPATMTSLMHKDFECGSRL